ncbi:C40 family peptidase [Streptomyces virginiae]|uniref:C40 family peptidase n=1 Tax=Streptomyces virginiae TaxID=1961 RepID=A0ABZ1TQY8_STRVG|nr:MULTISPECIES: C40 family peptidase [Streptomyces]PWK63342.1 NlpC/P60 family protein [Streptomyces sp. CG 926]MCX4718932.1 C40 family peptidase [Streptomyces virginiae]MCX5276573.1 C40 family peptidase [Streptomyces virginiae]MYV80221.1 NlpC/P60 family protein [Streptomyces sp. SID1046]WSC75190.1 C40 family peptidase [Streptomyces virginiae]
MSCFRTDFRKAPKGLLPPCCCPRARAALSLLLLTAAALTGPAAPAHAAAPYGAKAVAVAASKQGSPYAYGATGPKRFDCSGLTLYAFKKAGKRLPRTAEQQYEHTRHIPEADRAAGDLVFFPSGATMTHVGIYAGDDRIWHAPRPGTRVRLERIWSTAVRYGRAT